MYAVCLAECGMGAVECVCVCIDAGVLVVAHGRLWDKLCDCSVAGVLCLRWCFCRGW